MFGQIKILRMKTACEHVIRQSCSNTCILINLIVTYILSILKCLFSIHRLDSLLLKSVLIEMVSQELTSEFVNL